MSPRARRWSSAAVASLALLAPAVAVAQVAAPAPVSAAEAAAEPGSPAALRQALAQAREAVFAAPDNIDGRLALAGLLLESGAYRESAVQLAEVARMVPDHPQLEPRLAAVLRQWHAADPPRPGQASAYADYCKAAKDPVGGARLVSFTRRALAICEQLATGSAAPAAPLPVAPTAAVAAAAKPGGLTQDGLVRIWALTAIGAALFIGGGAWWTRKYRGKDPPRPR